MDRKQCTKTARGLGRVGVRDPPRLKCRDRSEFGKVGIIAVAAMVASVAQACGVSEIETVCEKRAALNCGFLFDCCNPAERLEMMDIESSYSSYVVFDEIIAPKEAAASMLLMSTEPIEQSTCHDTMKSTCMSGLQGIQAGIDEGRLEFDEDRFRACVGPLESAVDACNAESVLAFGGADEACGQIFVPKTEPGGLCYYDVECQGARAHCINVEVLKHIRESDSNGANGHPQQAGSEAPVTETATIAKHGECVRLPVAGEPCLTGEMRSWLRSACAPDLWCNGASWCSPYPGELERCDVSGYRCWEGLECKWNAVDDRVCVRAAQEGDSCGPEGAPCDSRKPLRCDSSTHTCVVQTPPVVYDYVHNYCLGT